MRANKIVMTAGVFWITILISTWISSYGHATTLNSSKTALRPEPLPQYTKGTTFVYSDGSWEMVVASDIDQVTWRNNRGYVSSGSVDFTRRRASWQTKTRQGTRQFSARQDLWFKHKTSLWPLKIGNVASYTENGIWQRQGEPETSYRANWSCNVVGTERISVMAGKFDTWKIVCKRYAGKKVSSKSRLREIKTWYYAPEVGHYVLATRTYYTGKPPKRTELLAVLPPLTGLSPASKRRIQLKFQKALESKKTGESLKWSTPDSSLKIEIRPIGTYRLEDGRFARRFVQVLNRPQGQQAYYGMAFRNAKGVWIIPRR